MSGLKLRFTWPYPDPIAEGAGISVVRANGNWTITLDWSKLGVTSPYVPVAGHFVVAHNPVSEDFVLLPTVVLPAAPVGTSIPGTLIALGF